MSVTSVYRTSTSTRDSPTDSIASCSMTGNLLNLFGFEGKGEECTGNAICAVATALELNEHFNDLQAKWIDIWEKHVPHKGTTVNIASRLADICDSKNLQIDLS